MGEDKLFVAGGYKGGLYLNDCELIDLSNNKINNNISNFYQYRKSAGIHYNETNQKIYLCGGQNALNKAEMYDVNKNEWYRLPLLKKNYKRYPIVFTTNNNILFCSSMSSGYLECIDLRMNNATWH